MRKKLIFCSLFLVSVFGYFSLRGSNNKSGSELLGVYLDGVYSENIPSKSDGYVVDKVECDNDATGVWDYEKWGLLVNNMNKKSRCNVYFKEDKIGNSIKANLDTTGKCPIVNDDGTVNVTGAESENSLLCMAPDNYGTSYYFRGNVSNNYVKFANFYWRIIRINGDSSIRLIYDGTSAHENGEASEDRHLGASVFSDKYDDNAYIGYMYGIKGSYTYLETHKNINDSTIKKYIDAWYENNIKKTEYDKYIADNNFCNDRSISLGKPDSSYTNLGYQKSPTQYRWAYEPWNSDGYNRHMSLLCKNSNDSLDSKCLKYSIGLITSDEEVLAGGWNTTNTKFYLHTGYDYWTMSPRRFIAYNDTGLGGVRTINFLGQLNYDARIDDDHNMVKPVINLKAGSLRSGDGQMNNPYVVE